MYSPVPTTHFRRWPFSLGDAMVSGILVLIIYGTISMAQRWTSGLQIDVPIDLGSRSLLLYSLLSLNRAMIAYVLSLIFTLVFGYWAGKSKTAERSILPLLDIGQSIPVLGFLPGLVLGLISVFPRSNTGIELACILMIFTGQVWNMAFSFYASVKAVPTQFHELSANIMLSPMQKLKDVELPYSASGLAWNSLMSMAGGWFFLTVCEAFTLGDKQFRLPGLGSYMAVAIEKGDKMGMIKGVTAMIIVIVAVDFVLWRPIIAWTRKFRLDEQSEESQDIPFMQLLYEDSRISRILNYLGHYFWYAFGGISQRVSDSFRGKLPKRKTKIFPLLVEIFDKIPNFVWMLFFIPIVIIIIGRLYLLLEPLKLPMVIQIISATLRTLVRVIFALGVSVVWTVPFAIWVGMSPKLTKFFQPLVQIAASFPAPMLYPLVLGILATWKIDIGYSSAVLMLLGVQWYVLFNVLAGATTISKELIDMYNLIGVSRLDAWKTLYIPSILPNLVTGVVTAVGGAWNASIVAEYMQYEGKTLAANGLGSLISEATAKGNYPMLGGGLVAMVVVVVALNNFVWRPLYAVVGRRYRFER